MTTPVEVLITVPFTDELVTRLSGVSPRLKLNVIKAFKVDDIPAEIWQRAEILYTHRAIPTPEQAPHLRWVQFHLAGIDYATGTPLLNKPDLAVTTLSGASASQVAEHVLMMLLALGHRLPDAIAHQKRAEWPLDRWERFNPRELRGCTVGIVGYGSIGRQVARLLHEFGATTLATKRDAKQPVDTGYTPEGLGDPGGDFIRRLYPAQAIGSMIKECDFVVVAVPLSPATRGALGARELACFKPTAFLVDVSRGGVVDHPALLAALKDQKIAGVALDVFPEEPLPADSPLWKLPNVILTPHISGNTPYYNARAVELFSENLHRYLAGLPLYNRVDLERGY
jgi:phosphoglycerate dehydrogenase-like enzyme